METNVILEPETLYDALDESDAGIAEFLLPLVFAGHVNQITWLKPSWATQMPSGTYKQLTIGERMSNGSMGITCKLPYFIEDELFSPVWEMNTSSTKVWDLFVIETTLTDIATDAITTARNTSKALVLDIDLDYFSTWNPFRKGLETQIDDAAVKTVTQVFCSVRYKASPLECMEPHQREYEKRAFYLLMKQLEAANEMQNALERTSGYNQVIDKLAQLYAQDVNAAKFLDDFIQILERYRNDTKARREIWRAGPFLDLPHHESAWGEIGLMINELEHFLRKHALDAPAVVTIAKSTADEFLPPHQEDFVLNSVLGMLEKVFGRLSIKYVGH